MRVAVLIPARDEATVLPALFEALRSAPRTPDEIVVVDNGSRDGTPEVARGLGARVVAEPRPGYGSACLAGITALRESDPSGAGPPDALVFLDADDYSAPAQLEALVGPIERDEADLVIGERVATGIGGVRWHARLGNRFVLWALRRRYGSEVRDMGPFRAIRWRTLEALSLDDRNYGWYVQMQVRALRSGFRVVGRPVRFERRTAGRSKVSGSLRASFRAGWVMIRTLLVETTRRLDEGTGRPDPAAGSPPAGGPDPAAGSPPAGGPDPTAGSPPAGGPDPTAGSGSADGPVSVPGQPRADRNN